MSDVAQAAADGEALSAEETAFFESRGEKSEGLAPETLEKKEPEKQPAKEADAKPGEDVKVEVDETEETVEVENKGRFVRHGAFHKERVMRKQEQEARRAAETKLAEQQQLFARADERLRLLNEALAPRQEATQQTAPPDPEQDIFGYVKWQANQIEQLKGGLNQTQQQAEVSKAEQYVVQTYQSDAVRFVKQQPDFGDAYAFLLQGRDAELKAFGMADPNERAQVIADEERSLVVRALNDRASPAERVYALAKARGFAPKPVEAAKPGETAKPAAAEQIETIARGQAASKTLSSAGGSPSETLTAEALANMSEEEFAAYLAKTPRSQQRAMMGG